MKKTTTTHRPVCNERQNMKAFIYVRVSTDSQASEGVSLDAQRARAEAWAIGNGYEVAGTFSDPGLSAKRADNRPGLQNALRAVCEAKGALVVYSLSRLARSVPDALAIATRLEKAGADLVSLTESIDTTSAAGRLIFTVFAAFAAFERELTAERTRAALAYKKSCGERVGQIPFGKALAANGRQMVDDESENAALKQITALRSDHQSWRKIADELNARGIATKRGRAWTWQTVRKVAAPLTA